MAIQHIRRLNNMGDSGWFDMFGDFLGKKIMIVLACVIIGVVGTYYASEIFLTEKEFKHEKSEIINIINTTTKDIRTDVLGFKQSSIEKEIWELSKKTDKQSSTRLEILKYDLIVVKADIKKLCDKYRSKE